jgi:TonB family protein
MKHRSTNPALVTLLAVLALSTGVWTSSAEARRSDREESERVLEIWSTKLDEIKSQLVRGKSQAAYKGSRKILREMTDLIIGGPGVGKLLGTATYYRAVAAVQLGREDEGVWYWHVAHEMLPSLADQDLSLFGDAGVFLSCRRPAAEEAGGQEEGEKVTLEEDAGIEGVVSPPRKKRAPLPSFPAAKRLSGPPVEVVVQVVIDSNGRPREPRILEARGELTLVWAVLDKIRKWEFHPATRNGEPVAVYYRLTVNFEPYWSTSRD